MGGGGETSFTMGGDTTHGVTREETSEKSRRIRMGTPSACAPACNRFKNPI